MSSGLRMALDVLNVPERHRYGPHAQHRCELWLPSGPGPHRAVVVIHGGFWRAKWGRAVMKPVCGDLARRGVAAWNIEYRRIGRGQGGGWPATFDDVAAAIDLLRSVSRGRLDPSDVRVVGHSAGGQLALWAASRGGISRVAALAAPCNLRTTGDDGAALMGGSPDEVPERYAAADPMELLPLGVPTLLVHGVEDATVPVKRSRRYAEAARAAGDDVQLIEPVPGYHRIFLDPGSTAWKAAADFLTAP